MALWKVTGTLNGKLKTVTLEAADYNDAVRRGSHAGYMLCVHDAQLVETPTQQQKARSMAVAFFRT